MPSRATVPFLDLDAINAKHRDALLAAAERVIDSGWYLLGEELRAFEAELAAYCGARRCVGVGSGLDALTLSLRALGVGPGDEVIVPAHTFIASLLAISATGAEPVLAEPREDTFNLDPREIERRVTPRTRAVMVVHLYGRCVDADVISAARQRGLMVVEDAAQALGACRDGRSVGTLGDVGAMSFYPGKNLGALGDGGAVVTDDEALADRVVALRSYGSPVKYRHDVKGVNSRLSEIQAAFLRVRLAALDDENAHRRWVASEYLTRIRNSAIVLPRPDPDPLAHSWHLFVIRTTARDHLQRHLRSLGIETGVHYPVPPHHQGAYAELRHLSLPLTERLHREVLSLPMGPTLSADDVDRVVAAAESWAPHLSESP